jgi:hypothetical protein
MEENLCQVKIPFRVRKVLENCSLEFGNLRFHTWETYKAF